jgi:hypothetical protein
LRAPRPAGFQSAGGGLVTRTGLRDWRKNILTEGHLLYALGLGPGRSCERVLPNHSSNTDASRTRRSRGSATKSAWAAWRVVAKHAPGKTEAQAREIIKVWVKNGVLENREYDNPASRKPAKGLYLDATKRPG